MRRWPDDPISKFTLRLIVWLPLCFALWYLLAGVWLPPLAWALDSCLQLAMPQVFRGLLLDGRSLLFDTHLLITVADGRTGSPMVELDPLLFSWNLPLLVALLLASPTSKGLTARLLLGYLLLLPAWIWGLGFKFAKVLMFDLGPDVAAQIGRAGLWLEWLALAYQLGQLVLPTTALILVWLLLARGDMASLFGFSTTANVVASGQGDRRSRRSARHQ